MVFALVSCNGGVSKYSQDERNEISAEAEKIFNMLPYGMFGDNLSGFQKAFINAGQKAGLTAQELKGLLTVMVNLFEGGGTSVFAPGDPVWDEGYDDGYYDGHFDGYYGYAHGYGYYPYDNDEAYLDGYETGYNDGYYGGEIELPDFEAILNAIQEASGAFAEFKDIGITGEKMGKFIYNLIKELKPVAVSAASEYDKEYVAELFNMPLKCATEKEFTTVFAAFYNVGLIEAEALLNTGTWEIVFKIIENTVNGSEGAAVTKSEFKTLIKTNIGVTVNAYDEYDDNFFKDLKSIMKKFNSKILELKGSELTEANKEVDEYISLSKTSMKAVKAILNALKNDDALMDIIYNGIFVAEPDEEFAEEFISDIIIAFAKYANIAFDNGVDRDFIIYLYGYGYNESEIDAQIAAIKALKGLNYGAALPENNKFVEWMLGGVFIGGGAGDPGLGEAA